MKRLLIVVAFFLAFISPTIAADSSVPGMGNATSVGGTDGFYCIQSGGTTEAECNVLQLSAYIQSTWGVITSGDIIVGGGSGSIRDVSNVTTAVTTGISSTKGFAYGAGSASSAAIDGNWWQNGATGVSTDVGTTVYHNWTITNDGVDASSSANGVQDFLFQSACCGTAAKGGRQLGTYFLNLNHAPGDTNGNYAALQAWTQASVNDGGTTSGAGKGNVIGFNPRATLNSGATFWSLVNGGEIDTLVPTGASNDITIGLSIVQATGSVVSPFIADYAMAVANGISGLSGRDYMLTDGTNTGFPALKTTGTWFSCFPHTNNNTSFPCGALGSFADLSNYSSVSGNILLGPASNGKIDGNFNISANSYAVGATAGVSCTGVPTAGFVVTNGIVTHC